MNLTKKNFEEARQELVNNIRAFGPGGASYRDLYYYNRTSLSQRQLRRLIKASPEIFVYYVPTGSRETNRKTNRKTKREWQPKRGERERPEEEWKALMGCGKKVPCRKCERQKSPFRDPVDPLSLWEQFEVIDI